MLFKGCVCVCVGGEGGGGGFREGSFYIQVIDLTAVIAGRYLTHPIQIHKNRLSSGKPLHTHLVCVNRHMRRFDH